MTMEVENFEFTVEHLLSMHRGWITKLFIDDNKSEVEIVELLYERHLVVTLMQIHQCLLDWNLIPPPIGRAQNRSTRLSLETNSDNWEVRPPRSSMPSTVDMFLSDAPEDLEPQALDLYTTRPLPSTPSTRVSSSWSSTKHRSDPQRSFNKTSSSTTRATCHPSQDSHIRRALDSTLQGISPLEAFLEDQQSHELLAMGLNRVPRGFYASEILRAPSSKSIVLLRSGTDQNKKDKRKEDHEKKRK